MNNFETPGGITFKTDRKIEDNSEEIEKLEQEKRTKDEELSVLFKRRDEKGISKKEQEQIKEEIKNKKREMTEIKNRISALKQKPIEEILESAGSAEKIAKEEKETPMPAVVEKEKEVKQEQPDEKEKFIEEDATEKEPVKKKRRRKLKPKKESKKEAAIAEEPEMVNVEELKDMKSVNQKLGEVEKFINEKGIHREGMPPEEEIKINDYLIYRVSLFERKNYLERKERGESAEDLAIKELKKPLLEEVKEENKKNIIDKVVELIRERKGYDLQWKLAEDSGYLTDVVDSYYINSKKRDEGIAYVSIRTKKGKEFVAEFNYNENYFNIYENERKDDFYIKELVNGIIETFQNRKSAIEEKAWLEESLEEEKDGGVIEKKNIELANIKLKLAELNRRMNVLYYKISTIEKEREVEGKPIEIELPEEIKRVIEKEHSQRAERSFGYMQGMEEKDLVSEEMRKEGEFKSVRARERKREKEIKEKEQRKRAEIFGITLKSAMEVQIMGDEEIQAEYQKVAVKLIQLDQEDKTDMSFPFKEYEILSDYKDYLKKEIKKRQERKVKPKEKKEESPEVKAIRVKKELFENAGNKSKEELVQLISDVEKILDEEKEKGKGKLKDKISEIRDSAYGKEKFVDGHIVYLPKDGEAIFVGDTHGDPDAAISIIEQEKFIEAMEKGEKNKYLVFLGDYVDKGEGDIENIEQIIALKKKYPDNVILLRGNHEGKEAAGDDFQISLLRRYGGKNLIESLGKYETSKTGEKSFLLEKGWITKIYSTENAVKELDQKYQKLFEKLPGVVVCGNGIVGVHGGIPNEDIKSLKDLNDPKKLYEMRWSDPYEGEKKRCPSERGEGITIFNKDAFNEFMKAVDGKVMARAHEYGVKKVCFDNKLLTVFSSGEGGEKSGYQNRVKPYYAKFNLGNDIEKIIGNIEGNEVRKVMYIKPNYEIKKPERKESEEKGKWVEGERIFGLEIKTREELEKMDTEELKKEGEGVFSKLEELKQQKDFEEIKKTEEYKKLLEYGSLMVKIYDRKKEEEEIAGAKEKRPEVEKEITPEKPKKYKEVLERMKNTVLALNIDFSKITPEEYGLAEKCRDGKLTKKEDIEKAEKVVLRQDLPDRARIALTGARLDSITEEKDPKKRAAMYMELREQTENMRNLIEMNLDISNRKINEAMLQGRLSVGKRAAVAKITKIAGGLETGLITDAEIVEEEKGTEEKPEEKKGFWARKVKSLFGLGKSPEEKKSEEDIKSQKDEIKTLEDELKASAGKKDANEMNAIQGKIDLAKKKLEELEAKKKEIKEKKEGVKSTEKELENRLSKAKEPKDLGEIIKDLFKNSKGPEKDKEALNEVLDKILERFSYKDDAEKSEKNKRLKEGLEFLKKSVEEGKLDYGSEFMNKFILKWLKKVEEMRKERLEGGGKKKKEEIKEEKGKKEEYAKNLIAIFDKRISENVEKFNKGEIGGKEIYKLAEQIRDIKNAPAAKIPEVARGYGEIMIFKFDNETREKMTVAMVDYAMANKYSNKETLDLAMYLTQRTEKGLRDWVSEEAMNWLKGEKRGKEIKEKEKETPKKRFGKEEWYEKVSSIFNSADIKNCKKEDLLLEMSNVKVRLSGEIQNNEIAEFYHKLLSEVIDNVDKDKIELKGGADLKRIRETLDSIGNEDAKNFFESVFERLEKKEKEKTAEKEPEDIFE